MFAVWSSSHFLSFFPRKWWLFTLGDVGLPDLCFIVCLVLLTSSYFFIFKLPENLVFLAAAIFSPGVFLQVLSLISVRYWLPNLNFYLLFSLKAVFTFLSVGLAEMGVIMRLFYFWTETYALYFLLLCSFLRTRLMVNVFLELVVTIYNEARFNESKLHKNTQSIYHDVLLNKTINAYFWSYTIDLSNSTCFLVTLLALGQSHNCIPVSRVTMNVWENILVPNPTLINKTWSNVYWNVARWGATHNSVVILGVQTPSHLHLQVNVLHARDQL